jgi:hypothetical protein
VVEGNIRENSPGINQNMAEFSVIAKHKKSPNVTTTTIRNECSLSNILCAIVFQKKRRCGGGGLAEKGHPK